MSRDEILEQVLRLAPTERARLAADVLSSLEEPEEEIAAAWTAELERRSEEVADGRVHPVDWDTTRLEILEELDQRRAGRSSS